MTFSAIGKIAQRNGTVRRQAVAETLKVKKLASVESFDAAFSDTVEESKDELKGSDSDNSDLEFASDKEGDIYIDYLVDYNENMGAQDESIRCYIHV